jgi:ABC-2 type transport system permease protein
MKRKFELYFEFARVAFLKTLAYRLRYFTGIATYFINVSVYYFIWQAIYAQSAQIGGFNLSQIVTYVAVGWIIRSFYFNNIDREIATEVMEGKIAVSLIKPVDPQLMYLSQTIGECCFRAVLFTLPVGLVVFLIYPVGLPASPSSAGLFVLSTVLALLIFACINFIVGTFALQLQSIIGVIRAKYFVVEFLSGLLLPITFFPASFQRILSYLPFPHISYTPLQIYLGRLEGTAVWQALAVQCLWIAVLFLTGKSCWRFFTKRLSIQGG